MSLPTKDDIMTLDFNYLGEPFVFVEAKTLDSGSLDFNYLGEPFYAADGGEAVGPPPSSFNPTLMFGVF